MPESFGSRIIAAHQAGLAERKRREQAQQQAEEFKIAQQQKKLELDNIKFQAALHQREIQKMTSGGPTGQATVETPQIQPPDSSGGPVATMPMPIQGLPQSVETGTPPAFPDIQSPYGAIPGTNKELIQAQNISDFIQGLKMKGMEEQQKADIQKSANQITLPPELGGGTVDKSIAPSLISQVGQGRRQENQQAFTAEQNRIQLKEQSDRAAADRASREAIATANRLARAAQAGKSAAQSRSTTQAMTLANRFDTNPVVKNYAVLNEAVQFASSLPMDSKNPADDIGLIYAFAKAMDPGSVVREGEYNTVERYAQSWADKFKFDVKRIYSNTQFLSPEARSNMKATILAKAKASETNYSRLREETAKKFKNIGEDPAGWITDYGTVGGGGAAPESFKLPDGTVVKRQADGTYR